MLKQMIDLNEEDVLTHLSNIIFKVVYQIDFIYFKDVLEEI